MAMRLKITLAFVVTALMAVVVAFVLASMVPTKLLAAVFAMLVAGAGAAAFGYAFGGTIAQSLTDLNNVILRFIKWDMEGVVPHAARADEVGEIAKSLKLSRAMPSNGARATNWSRAARSKGGSPRSNVPRSYPSIPWLDRRHSRGLRRERAADG